MPVNGLPRLTRRAALAGAAAAPFLPGRARAEDQMVIATWGGDYANLLRDNVEIPLVKPQGITVVQDVGDEDPRVAKMIAQRRLPRGSADVVCVQGVRGNEAHQLGLVDTLDIAQAPNLAHVLPNLRSTFYAPHIYSPQVIIYNPAVVKDPPKTFTDLLDPKYKGRVGVGDGNYFYVMMAAALAATGDVNRVDADATKALALKLNENGLRLYPSTDSIGAGIKSGEIDVGIMWLARVIMWQNAGIPVKATFQPEGHVLYMSGMVIPKNAPNKPAAYRYINAMLEPPAQRMFAEKMGYLPTVDNAPLSGKVGEQLALPTPPPKLIAPDYDVVGKLQTATADWWKKNMQRG
jgi:putative spermidine/putrescine transport system substrate-binding protein